MKIGMEYDQRAIGVGQRLNGWRVFTVNDYLVRDREEKDISS